MRSASHVFYLAVFALLRPNGAIAQHATRSRPIAPDTCAINPNTIVSDACTSYSSLDSLNAELSSHLIDITQNTDFFAYYRLNLYNKICPFWSEENPMCGNRACAVETLENEDDIPKIWRAEELSKLQGPKANHPGRDLQQKRPKSRPFEGMLGDDVDESCVFEDDDEGDERDYCIPEDEGITAEGDYVSLVNNTERFTGYSGPGPRQVWDAIYNENCFEPSPTKTKKMRDAAARVAEYDLKSVMQGYSRQNALEEEEPYVIDDECLEQRAFYRIISGMHASISTHICWDYFNQTTGEWVRNLQCYKNKLHDHPERVSNLYFNYALLTRALAKLKNHLATYTFCSGDPQQDFETKQKVIELADRAAYAHTFDETMMFQDPTMIDLKDDFKQRFRNVSRIMDCVSCDKCRLWGKLQTAGYGAALKVLFEFDENENGENPPLRQTELVALVNTMARISHSLVAIEKFRTAVNTGDERVLVIDKILPKKNQPKEATKAKVDSKNKLEPSEGVAMGIEMEEPLEPEESMVSEINHDDFEGLDDDSYNQPSTRSISEEFWDEVDLVWRAYVYVISSWISFPFKAWAIFVMEMNRLWNFWLGLPVPGRSWHIHLPTREEL